uniref:Tbc1 domain family member 13-like n=1 Tax=Tetraselmis sp. GSL018 TaxID=582737 RepID=A0A061RHF4_9CHLO
MSVEEDDHPLSQGDTSVWNAFFKDAEVMEQIERDVVRTHPDMHFFSGDKTDPVRHREEMKRALFIYAKLNPGLTYVQGMNELFAPLYYTFRTDVDEGARENAEADAFWCFVELMTEFRDNYCKQLDNSDQGIKATMQRLSSMLQQCDPELHSHLMHKTKVDMQFYAFRWITLLLTQEHTFPDTIRLWDTILSVSTGRAQFLLRVCTAMLTLARDELLSGDFSQNIKLLQRYPRTTDMNVIINTALGLRC